MPLTTGAKVAPIASPYLLQTAWGMTLGRQLFLRQDSS